MRTERIHELRALAEANKHARRSAGIIIECLDEIIRLQNLYSIALDVAYGPWKKRGTALRKLKDLAGVAKGHRRGKGKRDPKSNPGPDWSTAMEIDWMNVILDSTMNRFTRVVRKAPKPQTPVEALQLAEDMERIKTAIDRLSLIDPLSICESREDGEMQIRLWIINLRRCYDHAQQRLRRDYLAVVI